VARCGALPDGALLLLVDYAHTRADRPAAGSLAGYRAGRLVPTVPDGSCDLTAHVALDAVAAAARAAGAGAGLLTTQLTALDALGLRAQVTRHPLPHNASGTAQLAMLAHRSAAAELLDPDGLGGFSWLLLPVHRPDPQLPAG
jgi:SAM-dependent MidA family methyltransferase